MKFDFVPAPRGAAATRLWLMLPGAYMKPADFVAAGFVEAVHRRGLPHDIALLDVEIPCIADGSALSFLQEFLRSDDLPARPIGVLGISLGAHLALSCLAAADMGEAQGVCAARVQTACLLAPYLGPRGVTGEVGAAGSLAAWRAPATPPDMDRRIWSWLHGQAQGGGASGLYLGYGGDDRFARAHALMAQALPASQVDVQPGGHAWPVWTVLWNRHLDRVYGAR